MFEVLFLAVAVAVVGLLHVLKLAFDWRNPFG